MKRSYKVVAWVLLFAALFTSVGALSIRKASAGESDFQGTSTNFKYNSADYTKYVASRYKETVKCSYFLNNSGIGYGSKLGTVKIRTYCLVPKNPCNDDKYHNIIVYECEMNGNRVSTNHYIDATAEYASVGFKVGDKAVKCVPESKSIPVTVNSQSQKTTSLSMSLELAGKKKTGSVSGSWSSTTSMGLTYVSDGLSLSQNRNRGGYSVWDYDYITRSTGAGTKELDAWLRGTTHYTSGMVEYTSDSNASMTGKKVSCKIQIIFGAEWYAGSDAGKRLWDWTGVLRNKDYDLGVLNKTFNFSY